MTNLERQTRDLLLVEKYEGSGMKTILCELSDRECISTSQSAKRLTALWGAGLVNWTQKTGWTLTEKGREALKYVVRKENG